MGLFLLAGLLITDKLPARTLAGKQMI